MKIIRLKIGIVKNECKDNDKTEDDKTNDKWTRLHQILNDSWRASNWISSGQYLNDQLVRRSYARLKLDKNDPERDEKFKKAVTEIENTLFAKDGFFKTKRQATTERDIKNEFPNIPSCITNPLNQVVVASYNKTKKDIMSGTCSLRTYKQSMPITTTKTSIKFYTKEDKHYIKWSLGKKEYMNFYIYYGRDKSNIKSRIQRILDNESTYGAPQIQYKKNKLYLLLPIKEVEKVYELDENIKIGVDLGIVIPAYATINKGNAKLAIGSKDDLLRVRTQMQKRRRNLNKVLISAKNGHGRKRKLKALNRTGDKEKNFVQTYNHMISKRIIDFAIKNNAGQINLESLKGIGNGINKYILRNWSYFELQSMIQYKAKNSGIIVKFIDPYHTSQSCSECGNYEKGQRTSQAEFVCKNCGIILNADLNAAKNIANSEKYVKK